MGNAPTSSATKPEVEGLNGYYYGGNNPSESSGILQYVRVWYGGAIIGSNNEINGITFAGVGSGTTVDHVEVAFSNDDGIEFFGGNVNVKYASILFAGDDAIDIDMGYSGKIQFLYVMTGKDGHHGAEIDSKTNGNVNSQPRSHPQIYNAHFVGSIHGTPNSESSDDQRDSMIRLREGTGGEFGNIVLQNVANAGIIQDNCGTEIRTHLKPTSTDNYLWWSSNNVINGIGIDYNLTAGCQGLVMASNDEPTLMKMPTTVDEDVAFIDPRPKRTSSLYNSYDTVPADGWFTSAKYRGAFSQDLWLSGWSWLHDNGKIPVNEWHTDMCGDITTSTTWSGTVFLTCQVFVKEGATLTITAGTTVKAYRDDGTGRAPALVIERGAKIMARGTAQQPITFTSALDESLLPRRGVWGGLIILGRAPTSHTNVGHAEVEGLTGHKYGGNDPTDNSGVIQYVRVWNGGEVIGENNEINGITFAGVGSGTTVDHVEVAFNQDDGIEFFGGTVNAKYLSVLFAGDDGLDMDHGYSGKIQYAFVMTGKDGHHGAEIDSKTNGNVNSQPRTFPQVYNALFVGHLQQDPSSVSSDDHRESMLRLREGTGGHFANTVLTNIGHVGIYQDLCGSEERTSSTPLAPSPNYLYFSPNNIISGPGNVFSLAPGCDGLALSTRAAPLLKAMPSEVDENSFYIDPRPMPNSPVFSDIDPYPSGDPFFTHEKFKGAFNSGHDALWLSGWSWLSSQGRIPSTSQESVSILTFVEEKDKMDETGLIVGVLCAAIFATGLIVASIYAQRYRNKYKQLLDNRGPKDNFAASI